MDIPENRKFRGMVFAKIDNNKVCLYDRNGKSIEEKHSGISDKIFRKMFRFYNLQKQNANDIEYFYLLGKVKKEEFYMKEAFIKMNDDDLGVQFATEVQLEALSKEVNIPLTK